MPNFSGIWSASQQFQARGQNIWPAAPGAPTIGTATAGTALCASVTFTAPGCTGYPAGGITNYRVVSTPGCITATGAASPITITGLTCGTAYTFRVAASNSSGFGANSAASNSVTAKLATCAMYTTPGSYTWIAPAGVTSVAVVAIGGGGGATNQTTSTYAGYGGGGGGELRYRNAFSVTPGASYAVVVGAGGAAGAVGGSPASTSGGASTFNSTTVIARGGIRNVSSATGGCGGSGGTGTGGGNGGPGGPGNGSCRGGGGGGAGGYSGSGGTGGAGNGCAYGNAGNCGSGGGGGGGRGGSPATFSGGPGGGTALGGQAQEPLQPQGFLVAAVLEA